MNFVTLVVISFYFSESTYKKLCHISFQVPVVIILFLENPFALYNFSSLWHNVPSLFFFKLSTSSSYMANFHLSASSGLFNASSRISCTVQNYFIMIFKKQFLYVDLLPILFLLPTFPFPFTTHFDRELETIPVALQ